MSRLKKGLALVLTLCMMLSLMPFAALAAAPTDGITTGQPFSSGTGGSANFRIPALVTLSNGDLVAACDARWNHSRDGFGLDTIVSRSSNQGENWSYTFANYLGDNGNVYNADSTAFIDPALVVTSNDTIFMLVDLYPHGTYIGNVKAGTGFDGNGHLLLSSDKGSNYGYYVGDFADGSAGIYQTDGTQVSGYTVDEYYNITGNDVDTNLFFSDSPYQVLGTSYLYLTKSTDGGATWSAPMMLNSQVKNSSDMFYGVGPGRGLVTSTGRIMFPCYTYTTADGNTSVIYSDDGGATWTRSASTTSQTSEAALVEADGNIYMFTRHGGYYVSTNNGETWGSKQSVSGISYNTGCQISAITYSEKIDGKTAILLSAPGSTSSRANGRIFVGLVQDNGSITWAYTYTVNNSAYAYSCLTELKDGSIGLLYESDSAAITYTNLDIETIASGATIGENGGGSTTTPTEPTDPVEITEKDVTLYIGQTKTEKDSTGNYESSYTGAGLDTNIATVTVKGTEGSTEKTIYTEASVTCNDLINSDAWWSWQAVTGYYYTPDGTNYYPLYAKRSSSWNRVNKEWVQTYTYTWGYSTTSSTSNVTPIGTQDTTDTSTVPQITVYTKSTVDEIKASTTITFTGVAVGETSVTVGNTKYNITVKELPPYVTTETTPFVANTGVGDGKAVTKLTTSVGLTFDLDLNVTGSTVSWSVADPSIATVDQNGIVTGVAAGETTVTATIDGVAYTIPVVIRQDATSSSTKVYDFYLSEVTDTTVYMSISTSTNLVEVQEGEAIYISFNSSADTAVDFFGAPNEGYALTRMSSTNSAGDYMALNSTDPTQTDFYTKDGAAGKNQRNTFGDTAVANMVQAALDKDCDGGMGWTRPSGNSNTVISDLTFRSEKLPTVTKEVASVNGVAYTEGMVAHVGEKVIFNVTVTQYAAQDDITYSSVSLKDNLANAFFTSSNSSTKTITDLSNTAVSTDTTHTYQVEYTITDADLDKTIVNTVDLTYTYQSAYSSGSFGGTANADAKFTAASFNPQDIVIDFGLPVTIDYSGTDNHGRYDLASGTATYGDVTVSENKVTYTPNTVLRGFDTVTLSNTAGGTYTFKVYPATTVYYEEGFASYSNGWTGYDKGTIAQTAQIAGSSSDEYGYDGKYAVEANGPSNGSQATSAANAANVGDKATFTFTGTGADIYANCDTGSGTVAITVTNSSGAAEKFVIVNTRMAEGTSNATQGQDVTAKNVPIVSFTDLSYGTHTVAITHVKDADKQTVSSVSLDGFRVYGTLASEPDFYVKDQEDNPTFIELRDQVLAGLDVESNGSGQVNAKLPNEATKVALVANSEKYTKQNVDDLLNNGPKNEIYLLKDQALVFKITTDRKVQIGLKALNAETTYTITGKDGDQTISTSTDMFYTVLKQNSSGEQTITITNTGSGILSVTKLKVCDDPNAALGTLTEEDLTDALVSLGLQDPVEDNGSSGTDTPTTPPTTDPGTDTPTTPADPETGLPFTDVGPGDWFLENVRYVYEKGLMNGTGETTFSPQQTTNRAMIVTILHRLEGTPAPGAQAPFTDVPADQYYAEAVAWAAANSIVNGTSETTYAPLNNITREQMAAILYRYAQYKNYDVSGSADLSAFTDAASISDYAVSALQWAVDAGLINGKGNGILDPKGSATRAEVSAILSRFCENIAG